MRDEVETLSESRLDVGVSKRSLATGQECGDACLVKAGPSSTLLAVADGIGHGPEAAAAAQTAIDVLSRRTHSSPVGRSRGLHCEEGTGRPDDLLERQRRSPPRSPSAHLRPVSFRVVGHAAGPSPHARAPTAPVYPTAPRRTISSAVLG